MIQSLLLLNVGGEAHIEGLITDLAFILCLAAITTIIFKLIKQPVVLGYIVAGFLASPHFTYLPSVTTESNIEFWAQIGIIVLLFSLGLEFSFKKLMNAGGERGYHRLDYSQWYAGDRICYRPISRVYQYQQPFLRRNAVDVIDHYNSESVR